MLFIFGVVLGEGFWRGKLPSKFLRRVPRGEMGYYYICQVICQVLVGSTVLGCLEGQAGASRKSKLSSGFWLGRAAVSITG